MAKVLKADVVCWATPIYYYEMSGQMKTLIDRMNAMYEMDYQFRDVYLLSTAADDDEPTPKRAETGLTGWIDCYPKSRLAGTLFCGGVNNACAYKQKDMKKIVMMLVASKWSGGLHEKHLIDVIDDGAVTTVMTNITVIKISFIIYYFILIL